MQSVVCDNQQLKESLKRCLNDTVKLLKCCDLNVLENMEECKDGNVGLIFDTKRKKIF